MVRKLARLFQIKTRFEAYAVIYALAVGAVTRGYYYLDIYPGMIGYALFITCSGAVFMAGAKLLDATVKRRRAGQERRGTERRQVLTTA